MFEFKDSVGKSTCTIFFNCIVLIESGLTIVLLDNDVLRTAIFLTEGVLTVCFSRWCGVDRFGRGHLVTRSEASQGDRFQQELAKWCHVPKQKPETIENH